MLVDGCSIRSIERMTGVHRDTIIRLLIKTRNTRPRILDEKVRGFPLLIENLSIPTILTKPNNYLE